MLEGLTFLHTAAFALSAALPLLALAYLRRRSQKKLTVSSLLIFSQLQKRITIRKKIQLPLRFFLELLALLAIVIAAATPVAKKTGDTVAVLLDTSLSMEAVTTSKKTQLALAKTQLSSWLETTSAPAVSLYISDPELSRIGAESMSPAAVGSLLDGIATSYSSASLEGAVRELAQSGAYDRVLVVTDTPITFAHEGEAPVSGPATFIEQLAIDARIENAYLASLQFLSATTIGVAVGYSGPEQTVARISLYAASSPAGDEQLVATKTLSLDPETTAQARFRLSDEERNAKVFRAALETGPDKTSPTGLAADDTGWLTQTSSASQSVLVVSPETNLGLGSLPAISPVLISPEEYVRLSASRIARYQFVIFHQSAPRNLPEVSSLLVLPPIDTQAATLRETISSPQISSWAEEHPIASYMRMQLLSPNSALLLSPPRWTKPVLNVEQGPVLVAGELRGKRYVTSGIELFPFEGGKTPSLSILTLNILSWLSGKSDFFFGSLVGQTLQLAPEKTWIIKTPSANVETLEAQERTTPVSYVLQEPGVYEVTSLSFGEDSSPKREKELLVANAFLPSESNTYAPAALRLPRSIAHQQLTKDGLSPLWPYLAMVALALLIIELLLRIIPLSLFGLKKPQSAEGAA